MAGGQSCQQVAGRFGVSASSAIHWVGRWRATGETRPLMLGGDRCSRLKPHRELLFGLIAAQPDLTLKEIRSALKEWGIVVSDGTV